METIGATALQYLSSLVYRPDAGIVIDTIPFTGVYWTDEIPDHVNLRQDLREEECWQLLRLFCVRQLIWERKQLNAETTTTSAESPSDMTSTFWSHSARSPRTTPSGVFVSRPKLTTV